MLKQLLSSVWGILLFKKGPQDIPYSPTTLGVVTALIVGTVFFMTGGGAQSWLLFFNLLYIFVAFWILLATANKKQRYVQTMLAYMTCATVITLLCALFLIVVMYITISLGWMPNLTAEKVNIMLSQGLAKANLPMALNVILFIGGIGLLLWRFLVSAHILRHALDVTFQRAVFLIFIINLIPLVIHSLFKHA
jgi:hypothetical protein